MRPIQLTLSGLHSYRDPVTIDFDSLGRFGLFGIFGKIGSGKSTLLDALTLALYGLVDRVATRSRKGLIHLGSERCDVRLRFAVEAAGAKLGREVYEVHRAYREVDGVAQRVASRLTRLGASDLGDPVGPRTPSSGFPASRIVLAEKEAEVTSMVTDIVGLGAEDFMRAVVLPQGRFVQLLHLKGQDRRQMLQRIFRLQAYGETLRKQVRDRNEASRSALAGIRGELAGLGDASTTAVDLAERAAIGARGRRTQAERVLLEAREDHDAAARAREQAARVREAHEAVDRHLATAPVQTERLERIATALRLKPLVEPARRWREAVTRDRAASTDADRARERTAEASRVEEAARTEAEAARRERMEHEPGLRRQVALLEQVEGWEQELAAERDRAAAASAEAQAAGARSAEAEATLAAGKQALARIDTERRKLKKEHAKVRVGAEEREVVVRAARAADRVQAARTRREEAQRDEASCRATVERRTREAEVSAATHQAAVRRADEARAELAKAEADPDRLAQPASVTEEAASHLRWKALHESHRRLREDAAVGAVAATSSRAGAQLVLERAEEEQAASVQILRGAERALARAEAALEAARRRITAADLAAGLKAGEPCPVCGSDHHPAPADPGVGDLPEAAVEAHRAGQQKAVRRQEQAIDGLGRASAALEGAREAERVALDRLATAERAEVDAAAKRDQSAGAAARLEAHDAAQWRVDGAREAVRALESDAERAAVPLAGARAAADAARDELARAEALAALRTREEGDAWTAFDRDRGPFTLLELGTALVSLENRDRRAEALEQGLEQLEVERGEVEARSAQARTELEAERARLERARERLDGAGTRIAGLERQIRDQVGDGAAAELVVTARVALEELATRSDTADQHATAATAHRAEATTASARAEEATRAARSEHDAAHRALADLADRAGVELPDDDPTERWSAAIPDDPTLADWQRQAADWQDRRVSLDARLQALSDLPAALDDAAFAELVHRLETASHQAEGARDEAATTTRRHEELVARAGRHAELADRGDVLDRELGRLTELTQLLRGDRFVEFVANDHLAELTARAGAHLSELTTGRYGLALDDELAFVVRDEEAGGALRPVHTLSGGESFLTALSLALALSTKIQERSARPLGFFFLDEGFGTLDPEATDRVLSAIEHLRDDQRLIGLISHVPAIRERVPRYLLVSGDAGSGSTVEMIDN